MVSIGRSSLALFSLCRSSCRIHQSSTSSFAFTRRNVFTAATGLVATTTTLFLPSYARATSCDSHLSRAMSSSSDLATGYLNAADAAALDAELMSSPGFSLEQLMELAGLAVAEAVYQVVPPSTAAEKKLKILLICGPGNNGGDGLVAARHLVMFGYECVVVYPKRSSKTHFINLVKQCEDVGVDIIDDMPSDLLSADGESYHAIVDAIFGFSFKGAPREPFATALKQMQEAQTSKGIPVLSVDVPSGWNVDEGDVAQTGFVPQVLISLTTPKESAKGFPGRHFVGGRFLPPALAEKYKVKMPPYPGVSQVMEVTNLESSNEQASMSFFSDITKRNIKEPDKDSWEAQYAAYCAEQEERLAREEATEEAPNNVAAPAEEEESWEMQYALYCAEKEARLAQEDARQREALQND